jgi:hypothetical protein
MLELFGFAVGTTVLIFVRKVNVTLRTLLAVQ